MVAYPKDSVKYMRTITTDMEVRGALNNSFVALINCNRKINNVGRLSQEIVSKHIKTCLKICRFLSPQIILNESNFHKMSF